MPISASISYHKWYEIILHSIRRRGTDTTASRIATYDERIYLQAYEHTGQRGPKEGAAILLFDDRLAWLWFAYT